MFPGSTVKTRPIAGIPKPELSKRDGLLDTWKTSRDYFEPEKIKDSIVFVRLSFRRLF